MRRLRSGIVENTEHRCVLRGWAAKVLGGYWKMDGDDEDIKLLEGQMRLIWYLVFGRFHWDRQGFLF
jgi:hypothetical protein